MEDIYHYRVSEYVDIDNVEQYCYTNKTTWQTCQSTKFWEKLFQDYQLPIKHPQRTVGGWVREFRNVQRAELEANALLSKLDVQHQVTLTIHKASDIQFIGTLRGLNYIGTLTLTFENVEDVYISVDVHYSPLQWDIPPEILHYTQAFEWMFEAIYMALHQNLVYEIN